MASFIPVPLCDIHSSLVLLEPELSLCMTSQESVTAANDINKIKKKKKKSKNQVLSKHSR